MKTYNQFITELNKFEKFLLKQGVKVIKKLNPGQSHKAVKKSTERTVKSFRSDPANPFLGKGQGLRSGPTPLARQTPRLLKSGLKGVGKAIIKNPKLALGALAIGAAAKGIQALRNRK